MSRALFLFLLLFLSIPYSIWATEPNCPVTDDPIAQFAVDFPQGCSPLTVQFIDISQNAETYLWSFENGNPATSTDELRQELAVKIYSTIETGEFSVEVNEAVLAETTKVFIHNNIGQEIYNNTITDFKTQLNASSFASGIYYVTVMNKNGKSTEKLIKQ